CSAPRSFPPRVASDHGVVLRRVGGPAMLTRCRLAVLDLLRLRARSAPRPAVRHGVATRWGRACDAHSLSPRGAPFSPARRLVRTAPSQRSGPDPAAG